TSTPTQPPSSLSLLRRPPPRSTLFPYTTLFRSGQAGPGDLRRRTLCPRRAGLGGRIPLRLHPQREILEPEGHSLGEGGGHADRRSEEHTSELQSRGHLVCRLLLEKKNYVKKP